ncbi:MAG: DNA translocase FtsK 4TM domain-containing protein [Acidobacteriales bacterium]|nr:DNA translocase FtsK 4TM domain-containing protein [Terriglobales bacterium]
MKLLGPTEHPRLNEAGAVVYAAGAILLSLSLISYHSEDPSLNSSIGAHPLNWIGFPGSYAADAVFQLFGGMAFVFPVLLGLLAWKWVRSKPIEAAWVRVAGWLILVASTSALVSMQTGWRLFHGAVPAGGMLGLLLADYLVRTMNLTGALILTATCVTVSLYLVSSFSMTRLAGWFSGPMAWFASIGESWTAWRTKRRAAIAEKKQKKAERAKARKASAKEPVTVQTPEATAAAAPPEDSSRPPWEEAADIPIRQIEEPEAAQPAQPPIDGQPADQAAASPQRAPAAPATSASTSASAEHTYELPNTELLNPPPIRNPYDEQELKDVAARIKSKFEEFNVFGSVTQINPGPVVTTYEFKPEAGIKYSRITTLSEDLCLGLQAESVLIERIPGKPTVGIEVPNTKREVISLRQILESEEFRGSRSHMAIPLGKDISGRIKVSALDAMPHLLIAGSTGSGKSVMLNSMIMSVLFKSTPDDVRMIMVDPKRLELGLYEGIPHLLTPVITDPKKATNALRNAVLEMERRLKLLASQGVRNIEQYNKKMRQLAEQPRSLFTEEEPAEPEDLRPLPYILILIDELADLMMVERANVEEAVTRLAQMARAVGMHLVLATQRPSVDVITGLIKANFPARISFRVATRVDSRTILDVMGAEHLLGKGDMLFLPPGSARLMRVHGAFVTETEINRVVEFWKNQAVAEYDSTYLVAPPSDEEEGPEGEELDGDEDPLYADAVRVVIDMGKASTSILQRRLRLGYGRAARILDMMQRDGIIGPPDGSRPREVLKKPDWLEEVNAEYR